MPGGFDFSTASSPVHTRPRRSAWLLLLVLLAAGPGCGVPETNAPLLVGTNNWPGYQPLYLAQDLGHFDTASIRIAEHGSTSNVLLGLRNGVLDGAALTLDEAIVATAEGCDIVAVLVCDISNGADAVLAHPRGPRTIADLKGKLVGVEFSAVGAFLLARALEQHGLAPDEVRVVDVPLDQHEEAFRKGTIDAIVTFDPVRTRLVESGARTLFSSKHIPGEIVDILVVRRELLSERRAEVDALVEGWHRSLHWMRDHPESAALRLSPRLRLPAGEVAGVFRGLTVPDRLAGRHMIEGASPPLLKSAEALHSVMYQFRLLHETVPVHRLFPDVPPT